MSAASPLQPSSVPRSVVVLGGGLAGIAAAVRLAQRGCSVTLIETRLRLGGRATSFTDPTTGHTLDNCQHVLLGCCTNLLDLYTHLGVRDLIDWHPRLYFADGSGRIDTMEADDLPAPLHMAASLLAFQTLTLREKFAIARGMAAILRMGASGRRALHGLSLSQWLQSVGQPAGAIEKFWVPVAVGAVNETADRMAADYAIQVFQDGFLRHEGAYVMGLSSVPLVRLYDAAEQVIQRAGGTLLLSTSAHQLRYDGHRVRGIDIDGQRTIEADAFISALPADRLARVCPAPMLAADARLQRLNELDASPIIGIHLMLACPGGRPVMDLPHLVLMRSPLHWIFNKGMSLGNSTPEMAAQTLAAVPVQHLHGVVSAAHDLVHQPAQQILDMALREVRHALPGAADAILVHGRVVKEKRATFSARPGVDALRPPARGDIANLYLAGDWTQTGWPATMEGAVRSGYLAAAALLNDAGIPVAPLIPDLDPSPLHRWIAG